jgi:hypothetical protein
MCPLLKLPLLRAFLSFLWQPLTVLTRQTRQVVHAINQSIFLRCLCNTKSSHSKLGIFNLIFNIDLPTLVPCTVKQQSPICCPNTKGAKGRPILATIGSVISNGRQPKSCFSQFFNSKLGHFVRYTATKVHVTHTESSRVEN